MRRILFYGFVSIAGAVALVGAYESAGHRWWALGYAAASFLVIFGWDTAVRFARAARPYRYLNRARQSERRRAA